jgi:hypothetical protein
MPAVLVHRVLLPRSIFSFFWGDEQDAFFMMQRRVTLLFKLHSPIFRFSEGLFLYFPFFLIKSCGMRGVKAGFGFFSPSA